MTGRARDATKFYVWFDAEYSDVQVETAALLQVAALITDASLRRVLPPEDDVRLIIRPSKGAEFSEWVERNQPGLVRACRSEGAVDVAEADDRLAAYVDAAVGVPAEHGEHRPVLAGNTIHFDWWLIRRFLPRFLSRLHYRQLDVSALNLEWRRLHHDEKFQKEDPEIIRTYFPEAAMTASENRHDAYYDLQASVAELAFYRRHLFRSSGEGLT
jgi:oligoribonuclease